MHPADPQAEASPHQRWFCRKARACPSCGPSRSPPTTRLENVFETMEEAKSDGVSYNLEELFMLFWVITVPLLCFLKFLID